MSINNLIDAATIKGIDLDNVIDSITKEYSKFLSNKDIESIIALRSLTDISIPNEMLKQIYDGLATGKYSVKSKNHSSLNIYAFQNETKEKIVMSEGVVQGMYKNLLKDNYSLSLDNPEDLARLESALKRLESVTGIPAEKERLVYEIYEEHLSRIHDYYLDFSTAFNQLEKLHTTTQIPVPEKIAEKYFYTLLTDKSLVGGMEDAAKLRKMSDFKPDENKIQSIYSDKIKEEAWEPRASYMHVAELRNIHEATGIPPSKENLALTYNSCMMTGDFETVKWLYSNFNFQPDGEQIRKKYLEYINSDAPLQKLKNLYEATQVEPSIDVYAALLNKITEKNNATNTK